MGRVESETRNLEAVHGSVVLVARPDPFLRASGAASIRRRYPNADRHADLVEVGFVRSRALLASGVNRSIRPAGQKRVGLAPAGPDWIDNIFRLSNGA